MREINLLSWFSQTAVFCMKKLDGFLFICIVPAKRKTPAELFIATHGRRFSLLGSFLVGL
jgi:hypothetical protein